MVLGIGRDGTRLRVLLQTTQNVGEALTTGNSPVAGTILGTHIGSPLALQFLGNVGRIDGIELGDLRQTEGTRAVGNIGIGEQHDRSHVLEGYLTSLVGSIEAVGRTGSSQHRHGALAVTAEECLEQVGLFRLGGQTRGRTATLHVEHHEGQFHDDSEVHGLRLQADARARGRGDGQGTGERSSEG